MGNFRQKAETTQHNRQGKFRNLEFAVSHMCGWRNYMQDAFIAQAPLTNDIALFGVFDGHGGAEVSEFVQRHFCQSFKANENFNKGNYQLALQETFMKMDVLIRSPSGKEQIEKIQKQMRDRENGPKVEQPSHAGCTANVILITPDKIICANSGDSRAVASVKGQTIPLSYDHKPDDQIQNKRIQKAGGAVHYGRVQGNLNLSRAIGDLQYKNNMQIPPKEQMITAFPDIKVIDNKNVEFIIMGCDGIWQVKSNEVMKQWVSQRIKKGTSLKDTTNELLMQLVAKDSGCEYGMDNMSAILIKFNQ